MVRGLRGGPHLTGILIVLGLITLGNAVAGAGLELWHGRYGIGAWVGPITELLIAAVSLTWGLVRLRTHWGPDEPATSVVAPAWAQTVAEVHQHAARRRWLRTVRLALMVIALVFAAVALVGQWPGLHAGLVDLGTGRVRWLRLAIYAEALSMIAFARVQRQLLRAGGISLSLASMVEISLAGNGLRVSMPGGAAWAASFTFDQLRRRGANRVLAVYVVAVAWLMSALALIILLICAVYAGGSTGLAPSLRVMAGLLAAALLTVTLGAVITRRWAPARAILSQAVAAGERLPRWVRRLTHLARRVDPRTSGVRTSRRLYATTFSNAMFNWVADCGCLVGCVLNVTGHVPWRGILLVYVVAQVGASLPITPGGLGVVEGALTVGLVAYGMTTAQALASVLLYRIISFWALIPIGWSMWGALVVQQRRGVERAAWIKQPNSS